LCVLTKPVSASSCGASERLRAGQDIEHRRGLTPEATAHAGAPPSASAARQRPVGPRFQISLQRDHGVVSGLQRIFNIALQAHVFPTDSIAGIPDGSLAAAKISLAL
jgi:hypothetical protein